MDFTNVTKALTARGFKVSSFETAKEAAEYLNSQIDGATVGFGGSITLEELGLYALLSGHNTVFSHWHLPEGVDAAALAIVVLLLMMGSLFSWLRQDLAMTFADISDNITDAVIVGK